MAAKAAARRRGRAGAVSATFSRTLTPAALSLPWAAWGEPGDGQRRALLCSCKYPGITSFHVAFQRMLHLSVAVISMVPADLMHCLDPQWSSQCLAQQTRESQSTSKSSEIAPLLLKNWCSEKHQQLTNYLCFKIMKCLLRKKMILPDTSLDGAVHGIQQFQIPNTTRIQWIWPTA